MFLSEADGEKEIKRLPSQVEKSLWVSVEVIRILMLGIPAGSFSYDYKNQWYESESDAAHDNSGQGRYVGFGYHKGYNHEYAKQAGD